MAAKYSILLLLSSLSHLKIQIQHLSVMVLINGQKFFVNLFPCHGKSIAHRETHAEVAGYKSVKDSESVIIIIDLS